MHSQHVLDFIHHTPDLPHPESQTYDGLDEATDHPLLFFLEKDAGHDLFKKDSNGWSVASSNCTAISAAVAGLCALSASLIAIEATSSLLVGSMATKLADNAQTPATASRASCCTAVMPTPGKSLLWRLSAWGARNEPN